MPAMRPSAMTTSPSSTSPLKTLTMRPPASRRPPAASPLPTAIPPSLSKLTRPPEPRCPADSGSPHRSLCRSRRRSRPGRSGPGSLRRQGRRPGGCAWPAGHRRAGRRAGGGAGGPAGDIGRDVLNEPQVADAGPSGPVAGNREEVHLQRHVHLADEVGEEDERPLEDANEDGTLVSVVHADAGRQALNGVPHLAR